MRKLFCILVATFLFGQFFLGCSGDPVLNTNGNNPSTTPPQNVVGVCPELPSDIELEMLEAFWLTHMVAPLSEGQKKELGNAWEVKEGWYFELQNYGLTGSRYYGIYDGSIVLFRPGVTAAEQTIEVAGYQFSYSSAFVIYVYANGAFYTLAEAYAGGILTQYDIGKISMCHNFYVPEIEYYGEYDGCHVGFVKSGCLTYAAVLTTDRIAGKEFQYPDTQTLEVYKDGKLLTLTAAYDAGWLSDEAVARLWNYYTNGIYEVAAG